LSQASENGFGEKVFRLRAGQAHLLDLELIKVEGVISLRMAFSVKSIEQVLKSHGREGGLAPALKRARNNFLA
jgi:hypothetical protein